MHEVRRPGDATTAGTVCLLRAELYSPEVVNAILARYARVVRLEHVGDGVWLIRRDERGREPMQWRFVGRESSHSGPEREDSWVHELAMGSPPAEAWEKLVEVLEEATPDGRTRGVLHERWRITDAGTEVLVHNPRPHYANAFIALNGPSSGLSQAVSLFPAFPKHVDGTVATPVPPSGVVVIQMDGRLRDDLP